MVLPAALLLTVLTGFAGLAYEVVWQKYLAVLLGSHGEATAAVLAIFLGGLSVGYALFGVVTRRVVERAAARGEPPRLLVLYAGVEGAIGLYALVFPTLFGVARFVSLLGPAGDAGLGFAFDVTLSALLIGPPAVLMGGTIPILTLALAGSLERATRVHAWVYGCNTIGAFGGALFGGFFLVPWLGLDGVVYAMALVNLAAAAAFFALESRVGKIASEASGSEADGAVRAVAGWAAVALLAGFAMMALQTTLNRLGALALGSSQFTFSMIVAVFVLCIALGSLAVSVFDRIPRGLVVGSHWLLVALLFPLYLVLADVPYWAHVVRALFRDEAAAFYPYHAAVFGLLLLLLALPIGLSGALLPLLFASIRRQVRELGAVAGRLYAWNTVGSLLGSLLGGYLLLFVLDLHHVYRISLAALAVGATILTLLVYRSDGRLLAGGALVFALALIVLLPAWEPSRLASGVFRLREPVHDSFLGPDAFFEGHALRAVQFHDDDPTTTVTVNDVRGDPAWRSIMVNGKSDGSLRGDYHTMALAALVPALLADEYRRSFVIGWGTGVTAGELAALDGAEEVRVAEISSGVIASAPLFDHGNLEASRNPKVVLRRGDAYRSLLRSEGSFDVIVSEPSTPWVTGVEMLYSREFLTAARDRLSPGGVYAQWLHRFESDVEVVELVMRTYAQVFPHVSVWFTQGQDVLLLGFLRPDRALDVDALRRRFELPEFARAFDRVGIRDLGQLLAHELVPIGTLHAAPLPGTVHTLRHPTLSHRAARAFFRGETAPLPHFLRPAHQQAAFRNSLLRRAAGEGPLPEELLEAAAREYCRYRYMDRCATVLARWAALRPDSARLSEVLAELRGRAGAGAEDLAPVALRRLVRLYRPGAPLPEGGVTEAFASDLTRRFLTHYLHAMPFDRRVLAQAWRACRGPGCRDAAQAAYAPFGGS
ncbi:MAG: fused MFS/spermidine synthase [Myxococcota bacterium]